MRPRFPSTPASRPGLLAEVAGFGTPRARVNVPTREEWAMETAREIRNLRMSYDPFNKEQRERLEALEQRRLGIKDLDPDLHDRMMKKIEAVEWEKETSAWDWAQDKFEDWAKSKAARVIANIIMHAIKRGMPMPLMPGDPGFNEFGEQDLEARQMIENKGKGES